MWVTRPRYESGSASETGRDEKSARVVMPPVSVLATCTVTQMNTKQRITGELNVIFGRLRFDDCIVRLLSSIAVYGKTDGKEVPGTKVPPQSAAPKRRPKAPPQSAAIPLLEAIDPAVDRLEAAKVAFSILASSEPRLRSIDGRGPESQARHS